MSAIFDKVLLRGTAPTTRLIVSLLTSLTLLAVGKHYFDVWMGSHWINYHGIGHAVLTMPDVIAITIATFCFPLGSFLLLHAISTTMRLYTEHIALYTIATAAVLAGLSWMLYGLYDWAGQYYTCKYWFLCFNTKDEPIYPVNKFSAQGLGFRSTIVLVGTLLLAILILTFVLALISKWRNFFYPSTSSPKKATTSQTDGVSSPLLNVQQSDQSGVQDVQQHQQNQQQQEQEQQPLATLTTTPRKISSWSILFFTTIAGLFTTFFFIAAFLPGQFRNMAPERIATYVSQTATLNFTKCRTSGLFTCPEYPNAFFVTQTHIIDDGYLVLKFFPSNYIPYAALLIVCILALIVRASSTAQALLKKKIRVPRYTIFTLCSMKREMRTKSAQLTAEKQGYQQDQDQSSSWPSALSPLPSSPTGDDNNNQELTINNDWATFQAHNIKNNYKSKTAAPQHQQQYAYWSAAEVLTVVLSTFTAFLVFYYWFVDHDFRNYWLGREQKMHISQRLMRSSGQLATFLLALCLFPAARTSPLLQLFGISFENSMQYHRWSGLVFLVVMVLHMLAGYWVYLVNAEYDWKAMFKDIIIYPQSFFDPNDDWSIWIMQIVCWMSLITIGVIALYEPIRRRNYNFFVITHYITYLTMIPATLWHASNAWQYLLPALSLWVIDRALRFYRGLVSDYQTITFPPTLVNPKTTEIAPTSGIRISHHGLAGDYVELRVVVDERNHRVPQVGQYYFLNIAELSLYEYHPMTLANAPRKNPATGQMELDFVMKAMGKNSWTGGLYDYIQEKIQSHISPLQIDAQRQQQVLSEDLVTVPIPLTLTLDGPYGEPVDYSQYDNIILIGGGVGITPVKAVYEQLLHAVQPDHIKHRPQRVHMVFSARDASFYNIMYDALQATLDSSTTFPHATAQSLGLDGKSHGNAHRVNNIQFSCDLLLSKLFFDMGPVFVDENDPKQVLLQQQRDNITQSELNTLLRNPQTFTDRVGEANACVLSELLNDFMLTTAATRKADNKTLIFVCGPHAMVERAEAFAFRSKFDLHAEVFDF